MHRLAVIDFETTGLSPCQNDRATEIAVVMLEDGRVVDRFQSLMNAGVAVPSFSLACNSCNAFSAVTGASARSCNLA